MDFCNYFNNYGPIYTQFSIKMCLYSFYANIIAHYLKKNKLNMFKPDKPVEQPWFIFPKKIPSDLQHF